MPVLHLVGRTPCSSLRKHSTARRRLFATASGGQACTKDASAPPSSPSPQPQLISTKHKPLITNRRAVLGLTALALCSCCPSLAPQAAEALSDFTYGTQSGPPQWGGTCSAGASQSPVNITHPSIEQIDATKSALKFDYNALRGATVLNSGHGTQVNVPPGNILITGGQQWQMVQFHFHTPSEHSLDGRRAAMEAHLVHKNLETGALGVVGVMLEPETGRHSRGSRWCSALEQALELVPAGVGKVSGPHDLDPDTFTSLIPGSSNGSSHSSWKHQHVHYSGSLTTPPCTEGVSWYVLLDAAPVGAIQVLQFQRLLGAGATLDTNARPAQAVNGRVFDYERSSTAGSSTTMEYLQ